MRFSSFVLSLFALAGYATAQGPGSRLYTVVNRCPIPIRLFIGAGLDSTLPVGSAVNRTLGVDTGFFYTDANGGNANGAATKVGFSGYQGENWYYIIRDVNVFNTGIYVQPNYPPENGYCLPAVCNSVDCAGAYPGAPNRLPPAGTGQPPPPPAFACPRPDLAYTITFCPTGKFPEIPTGGKPLHPNGNKSKCMDVRGNVRANGTPVQIYDCNGTGAQKWVFNRGDTKVRLAGTNFCLDAGSQPASGIGLKIWQCYENLPAQRWIYGTDNKIVLYHPNPAQCVDLRKGNLANWNPIQTWQCYYGNTNQIWTID